MRVFYSAICGAGISGAYSRGARFIALRATRNSSRETHPSLFASIIGTFSAIFGHFTTRHPFSNSGYGLPARLSQQHIFAAAKPNAKMIKTKINFFRKRPNVHFFFAHAHSPPHAQPLSQPHGNLSATGAATVFFTSAAFFAGAFLATGFFAAAGLETVFFATVFFAVTFFVVFSAFCPSFIL